MLSKPEVRLMAREQVALDLACSPRDFLKAANTVVPFQAMEGRRPFQSAPLFSLASFGRGTVAAVAPALEASARELLERHKSTEWFAHGAMCELDAFLASSGYQMGDVHLLYLPDYLYRREDEGLAAVKWFEREEIPSLYADTRFANALTLGKSPLRPDMLAVASYDEDGQITAMAGANADSEKFWQIGIDVLPDSRREGLGRYLVGLLTTEVMRRDAIPYYGTLQGNLASRSIARSCGYYAGWIEMYAQKIKE